MRPAQEWKEHLAKSPADPALELTRGKEGQPTLKARGVLLHSRYAPDHEAERLVQSAGLAQDRPVLVVGLGLGYHVLELIRAGHHVAVVEPDAGVAKHALEGPAAHADFLLAVGTAEETSDTTGFRAFAERIPQVLVHPPSARLHPGYAEAVQARLTSIALSGTHLSIAVVGPMYGGSLPIAGYLVNALRGLGHRVLDVANDLGWPLHESITKSVRTPRAAEQLTAMLTNALSEWTYARVAEFNPEICIVLAQAPVSHAFPERLAKLGILSAFWYVENWRHLGYWRDTAPRYDAFFHIQPGEFERMLDAAGCAHHAFVQTGCDPAVHRPMTLSPDDWETYGCDISFAGAGYHNRREAFKGLTDYDFKIWGIGWASRELSPKVAGGERSYGNDEFMKVVAGSKINLNLHSSQTREGVDPECDAINPRVFEIAAAGGFQLCDPCVGLDAHFDFGTELPVYRDLKELRDRIDYFLAHPGERAEIAGRARERALREHTYGHRAARMIDFLIERHGARLLRRGIRVQRTVGEVAERLSPDSALGRWLGTLPEGLLFTHEGIESMLEPYRAELPEPAKVFLYMREVRHFAESVMKAQR